VQSALISRQFRKFATFYQDLKSAKSQLGEKLHEIENDRRVLHVPTAAADDIETFLAQECDIAIRKRDRTVSAAQLSRAEEVLVQC
jgi:vacuolar-type H+-ATPase subunit E/Vma4